MIAQLREAKEHLSDLVKRAAGGEEIIITVRGQPMARLSSAQPIASQQQAHTSFADELDLLAASVRTGKVVATPQSIWDDLREDRL